MQSDCMGASSCGSACGRSGRGNSFGMAWQLAAHKTKIQQKLCPERLRRKWLQSRGGVAGTAESLLDF